jgi:AcrR family transcriptional regulator
MPTVVGINVGEVRIEVNKRWQTLVDWDSLGRVTGIDPAPGRAGDQPAAVPGTGGPRSEGTRRAILAAARSAFAARGYEQATIRAVAAQAGVDASMVMRYFGSKAGLFTAAATMDLHVPDLRSVPAARRGELLVRHVVGRWEDTTSDDELIVLLRTAVTSEAVAAQVQEVVGQLITAPIAALGGDGAAERAGFIAAQLLGVALCRYILRLEPLASMPADEVVAELAPAIQRYLGRRMPPIT